MAADYSHRRQQITSSGTYKAVGVDSPILPLPKGGERWVGGKIDISAPGGEIAFGDN